jgi:hypothetical protein
MPTTCEAASPHFGDCRPRRFVLSSAQRRSLALAEPAYGSRKRIFREPSLEAPKRQRDIARTERSQIAVGSETHVISAIVTWGLISGTIIAA